MDAKEFTEKRISLGFEFQRYLIAHPEVSEKVAKGAQIFFILEDDTEFTEQEMGLVKEAQQQEGEPIVFVKVEKLIPPFESRLVNPRIEVGSSLGIE